MRARARRRAARRSRCPRHRRPSRRRGRSQLFGLKPSRVVDQHGLDRVVAVGPQHRRARGRPSRVVFDGVGGGLEEPAGADVRFAAPRPAPASVAALSTIDRRASASLLLARETVEQIVIEAGRLAVRAGNHDAGPGRTDDDQLASLRRSEEAATARGVEVASRDEQRDAHAPRHGAQVRAAHDCGASASIGDGPLHEPACDYTGVMTMRRRRSDRRRIMRRLRMRTRSTAGRPALHGREPGQVRKEAATANPCKCRGNGSPPFMGSGVSDLRRWSIAARCARFAPMSALDARSAEVARTSRGRPDANRSPRTRRRHRPAMSYQVLARKWRPKTFAELVGQEHVVTALTNALDARPAAPRVPAHRHARRRQDHDRAHPRQEPQLRDRRHARRRAACAPRASTSTPAASSTCSSSTPRRTPASTTCARSSTTRATRRRSAATRST